MCQNHSKCLSKGYNCFSYEESKKRRPGPTHSFTNRGKGLRMYNAMTLREDQRKDPAVVFEKLGEQIEPAEHFRVSRLKLMNMRQASTESLDDFVTKAQLQAKKCAFDNNAELEERLIELIISSTPIGEFQQKLLEQKKV